MRTIRPFPATLAFLASFFVLFVPQVLAQTPESKRPPRPGVSRPSTTSSMFRTEIRRRPSTSLPRKTGRKAAAAPGLDPRRRLGRRKQDGQPYLNQLARGYVVASIEYRFSQKAIFPAQIQDCQAAIRWLRANAKKYNIDPDHIGVGGASAGGHLAALLGTSGGKKAFPPIGGNEDQSDRVQAVCDIFGPADFWTVVTQANEDKNVKNVFKWNNGDPYSKLIGAKLGEDKEKCDAVSPTHYVSKDNPPFLILHGDRDTLVPYAQSVELADLLTKAGVAGHAAATPRVPATAAPRSGCRPSPS